MPAKPRCNGGKLSAAIYSRKARDILARTGLDGAAADGIPVIRAWFECRAPGVYRIRFVCPCGRVHRHGSDQCERLTHRVSHCTALPGGYYLEPLP